MSNVIHIEHLNVHYHGQPALEDISFALHAEQIIGIIGPNGAGKSTLMKAILGLIPYHKGRVTLWDQPIHRVRKQIAYVPQRNMIDFDFPVRVIDVVLMGRYPHLKWWERPKKKDLVMADDCLDQVGMSDFRMRQIGELSGGQQQRVFLARALAQDAHLFFLDEPFAGIDATSETIIIELLRKLSHQGKTLLVVHHDLSKVEQYFDSLLLLNKRLLGCGTRQEVFQMKLVSEAYGGNVAAFTDSNEAMVVGT